MILMAHSFILSRRSMLAPRHPHNKPIEVGRDLHLTREATIGFYRLRREFKHCCLGIGRPAYRAHPVWIDVHMAGGTRTRSPAVCVDAGHIIFHCTLHDGTTERRIHYVLSTA
jgi:hypothetical protein